MAVQTLPEVGKFALSETSNDVETTSSETHILIVDDENGPRQALRMLL